MSAPTIALRRCCARQLSSSSSASTPKRSLSNQCLRIAAQRSQQQQQQRRWQSSDAAAQTGDAAVSPKIAGIVDQISTLTLLETADLVKSLKVRSSYSLS
jgi:large subunit ribosomal protein L7/L12